MNETAIDYCEKIETIANRKFITFADALNWACEACEELKNLKEACCGKCLYCVEERCISPHWRCSRAIHAANTMYCRCFEQRRKVKVAYWNLQDIKSGKYVVSNYPHATKAGLNIDESITRIVGPIEDSWSDE